MPREKEFDCLAHCPLERGALVPDDDDDDDDDDDTGWTVAAAAAADALSCVYSPADTSLRLSPMFRKTPRTGPRWKPNVHFHADLNVTTSSKGAVASDKAAAAEASNADNPIQNEEKDEAAEVTEDSKLPAVNNQAKDDKGLLLCFEAIAREGIAVAFSPQPKYTGGTTYEIFYGDRGNTQSLIERRARIAAGENSKLGVAMPGRHCTENVWTKYWIAFYQGKVYAGIGKQPPHQCLSVLDDIAHQDQPDASTGTWYVGMGNSSMHRQGERPFFNQYRNIRLSTVPSSVQQLLKEIDATNLPIVNVQEEEMDEETKALLKEYEQECQKAKARAEKFGVPYKEPPSFLPWSKMRRLQANPKDGFATGLDLQDPAEKAKQEARRKRFGLADMDTTSSVFVAGENVTIVVPVTQAWDNEKLVKSQRVDPPRKLWKVVPPTSDSSSNAAGEGDVMNQSSDTFAVQPTESNIVPEKIHLFAIDWAAFKQIRTNDLSAYFSMYSPTYVEWLGDLSCNIHFQDKFSAARALENLSQEIPTPPPPELEHVDDEKDVPSDLGAMGWRFGKTMLRKVSDDRYGRRGTTARILLRLATSTDVLRDKPSAKLKPPPGFSRNRVLGPGSDFSRERENKAKRSRTDRQRDEGNATVGDEPALLSGSLKASRSGFSVEEMEAERAKKRTKMAPEEGKSPSEGQKITEDQE